MNKVTIDVELCKGCGLCESVCPKKIMALAREAMNSRGYHPAQVSEPEKCTACALCATICPDVAIKVEKGED